MGVFSDMCQQNTTMVFYNILHLHESKVRKHFGEAEKTFILTTPVSDGRQCANRV